MSDQAGTSGSGGSSATGGGPPSPFSPGFDSSAESDLIDEDDADEDDADADALVAAISSMASPSATSSTVSLVPVFDELNAAALENSCGAESGDNQNRRPFGSVGVTPPPPIIITPQHHHVNLQDRCGKTLLIHNCAKGLVTTVEELSNDANIDVNIADNEGNTALHHAAQAGHANVLQVLLERFPTIRIDQLNKLGQTALIKAAIQGRTHCAKLLLTFGADPYLRDFGRQFCALEWAEYVGRTECAHAIAHFMLTDNGSVADATAAVVKKGGAESDTANGARTTRRSPHGGRHRHNANRATSPASRRFRYPPVQQSAAAATAAYHYYYGGGKCGNSSAYSHPPKKFSETACDNFKQVACLAAIPLIGGRTSGGVEQLPAVVRPRVRSAPPIPTFKITTPQQSAAAAVAAAAAAASSSNADDSGGATRTPLMAAVVAHCRVRPSSSCA